MNGYQFGYPMECSACSQVPGGMIKLRVQPYYHHGQGCKLMLIGQDPTIFRKPEQVKHVLMLDEPGGQLTRWLSNLVGGQTFESLTLYATNLVKCSLPTPPSLAPEGGLRFLSPYYENCREHLKREIDQFRPDLVVTLGEPTHRLFVAGLDNSDEIPPTMQEAFTGSFVRARSGGVEFDYSPCLHIKTFRVAETYGTSVSRFKAGLRDYLTRNQELPVTDCQAPDEQKEGSGRCLN